MRALTIAIVGAAVLASSASPAQSDLQRDADRLIATSDLPAVIALVEQDGVRQVVASGLADVARKRPARTDDRVWVGSVTKEFVGVVVMQLVDERRLSLDDTLARRLPGVVREGRRVRVRNLLNHTSGIPDYMALAPFRTATPRDPRVVLPPRRLIATAVRLPLEFTPGTRASYSNTNSILLGEIVKRVTGEPLARVLRERIFEPLGLEATVFASGGRRLDPSQLHGYDVAVDPPLDVSLHGLGGPWADGAIVSSVDDLADFTGALLRGRIVPRPLLAKMMEVVPRSRGEGLAIYRLPSPCGRFYWGHTGGTPGYVTFAAGSRDARRIVVVTVNGVSTTALAAMGTFLDGLLCD
jgi:D-alanyl-D-alanine carboxypeptidase